MIRAGGFEAGSSPPSSKRAETSAAVLAAAAYLGEGPGDLVHVQDDFHQLQVLLIARLINLGFDLRLNNVVHGQAQGDPRQRPGPSRVPVRHGLSIEFLTVGIGSAEDDDEVLLAVLFGDLLDTLLTLQVKGTGRGSDKALCLHEERLGARAPKALRNSRPLYPIPFA
jgi:hypothetical protein